MEMDIVEILFGLRGRDFVMVAADTGFAPSIAFLRNDVNKIFQISKNVAMAIIGHSGDAVEFQEHIRANMAFYSIRNGYDLSPKRTVHFARNQMVLRLRTGSPYSINILMAGYDPTEGPQLNFVDRFGNCVSLNHGGQGIGWTFCTTVFEQFWKPDLNQEQAYEILQKCVSQLRKRFSINLTKYNVVCVDQDGVQDMDQISVHNL